MPKFRHALPIALALASVVPGGTVLAADHDAAAKTLLASAKFRTAKQKIDTDFDRMVEEIVTLTEIPAPPFKEAKRGAAYAEMLKAAGLADVTTDAEGNVYGTRKGTGGGPLIVIAAHLDTVFPEGTVTKVRREGDRMYAPGIGDDTMALPVLLAFVRAMDAAKFSTASDIVFMGNVGEEGPGDLRGMRYLFGKGPLKDKVRYFISFEPGLADRITDAGTGSRRYKVTFKGPGGHSMGAFGVVNPAYAMAAAMVEFGRMQVPKTPKTVYNVGIVEGGTSVNSIPFETAMTIDMRSNGKPELDAEEKTFLAILPKAVDAENATRDTTPGKISYDARLVGDRPVGSTPRTAQIHQIATAVAKAGGLTPSYGAGSSDSNIPMSLGVQALTLGSGFETFRNHSLDEGIVIDKPRNVDSIALGLATVLLLAGAK